VDSDDLVRRLNIKSSLENITPGPWAVLFGGEYENSWHVGTWQFEDESWIPAGNVVQEVEMDRYENGIEGDSIIIDRVCENHDAGANLADAYFIASAPETIRYLLARVEELEHHLNPRPAARPPITGEYATG
jgi:hypothetical protein